MYHFNPKSYTQFFRCPLRGHTKNPLPQKRAVFMVRNFSPLNRGLGVKSTLKTKTCRFSFKQFFRCESYRFASKKHPI